MVYSSISDVAFTPVYSEKTHLKKLMMMKMMIMMMMIIIIVVIIMNKSQEMTIFSGRQILTSTTKLKPEK